MPLTRRAQHRRAARGFTLVELLVTITILGVMGTMVAQLMMSQQRFSQRMSDQSQVRRELRSAVGTLPTELRGVAAASGDISAFAASSLAFRSTLGTSFVCARSSSTSVDVPPLNTARIITSNWVVTPAIGDTLFALRHDSSGVKGDFWSPHRITAVSASSALCPSTPYADSLLDVGKVRFRFTVTPALPDSVTTGSSLRFTRSARYQLAQQPSGRWYLQRTEIQNGTWIPGVIVGGPFMAPGTAGAGGFALTYFDSTGSSLALGSSSLRIARIDLTLRAQGQGGSDPRAPLVQDSVKLSIAMRNRR
jgi:prepilin-type N-terminal cleavage/methylation domain-containing protein